MNNLRVSIAKHTDGRSTLHCRRPDQTETWQTQARHGQFFAFHDLTHFTVETTLAYTRGFFGLIAEGWDIDDTTGKGKRGPLPPEAGEVEWIVGVLDMERAGGTILTTDEFNQALDPRVTRRLTTEDLARVRARRSELFTQWMAVAPGETLELELVKR